MPTKKQPRKAAQPRASKVSTRREVHPLTWSTAMRLADGDASRITVESYMSVLVR